MKPRGGAIKAGNMVAVCQDPAAIGATCLDILVDAIKAAKPAPRIMKLYPNWSTPTWSQRENVA